MPEFNLQESAGKQPGFLLRPLSSHGFPIWTVYLIALLGLVYMLNPTAGFFEAIPDNLPFVGNLDEGAAAMMLWYGLVEFFEGRKYRPRDIDVE